MMTLDNLEKFTIPLQDSGFNWFFKSDSEELQSPEHQDQIFVLTREASVFLWDLQNKARLSSFYPDINQYFKDTEKVHFGEGMERDVKKWLYRRGIPFRNKVFVCFSPDSVIVMTWKMIIHCSPKLFFGQDVIVWDRTFNWALFFHHDDIFHFGKNRIYDGQEEQRKLNDLIQEVNKGSKKV